MDTEFHYYITHILAKKAGFNPTDSQAIAYSSQYTDDNKIIYTIKENGSGKEYQNYISQTMNILAPKMKLLRIYPIFHFMPGKCDAKSARRKDGKRHVLMTTPNSVNAQKVVERAFASKNLYRIGIALHTYADTWAHQNFVGYYDAVNAMGGLLEKLSPNIGHADARFHPDTPSLLWHDTRLVKSNEKISNNDRFLDAALRIYEYLWFFTHGVPRVKKTPLKTRRAFSAEWANIEKELRRALGPNAEHPENPDERIRRYKELDDINPYDPDAWFSAAVETTVHGLRDTGKRDFFKDEYEWKDRYQASDWYKFQQAVKDHQDETKDILRPVFDEIELEEF